MRVSHGIGRCVLVGLSFPTFCALALTRPSLFVWEEEWPRSRWGGTEAAEHSRSACEGAAAAVMKGMCGVWGVGLRSGLGQLLGGADCFIGGRPPPPAGVIEAPRASHSREKPS